MVNSSYWLNKFTIIFDIPVYIKMITVEGYIKGLSYSTCTVGFPASLTFLGVNFTDILPYSSKNIWKLWDLLVQLLACLQWLIISWTLHFQVCFSACLWNASIDFSIKRQNKFRITFRITIVWSANNDGHFVLSHRNSLATYS